MTKNKKILGYFLTVPLLLVASSCFSLSLRCVIEHTLHTNPDVLQTIHTLEAVNEQVKEAQADFYPTIDLTALYGREISRNSNTNFQSVGLWKRELGVTLVQMLFDGYQTRNNELQAMAKADAEAFRIFSESEDIALAAAESYINILRDQELIAAGEKNVASHKRLEHMVTRRTDQGVGRVSDKYQAQSRLAFAEAILWDLKQQYNQDRITFQRVTGLCPDCLEEPPSPCNLPPDACDAIKLALFYHPTLKTSIADVEAARSLHRATFGPNFPRIDLLLTANNNQNEGGIPGPDNEESAVVRMQWNIFRGGKDYARQRETAFEVKAAMDTRDKTYRAVVEQISTAWNVFTMTGEKMPSVTDHMTDAAKTADAFYKLFMVGRSSLFDLLGTEQERFTSAQDYINTKYLNLVARYRILNALGGLNCTLGVRLSRNARPCYHMVERAGTKYGPVELDYRCLHGGCCPNLPKPDCLK